ncbi:hypothetical protein GCM10020366_70980 [Saccharopolyspora gregorii]|uniref:Uncharacterized protein n=1 Tax=Saccharopolyspora gregorii TaxID=33914 RepID=A0ABP6S2W4_9PSEU
MLLGDVDAQPAQIGHLGVELLVVQVRPAVGELVALLLAAAFAAAELEIAWAKSRRSSLRTRGMVVSFRDGRT